MEFLKGDDQALSLIYSRLIQRLYNYGRQFTSDKALVKDCIHDIFCQLIDQRDRLGPVNSVRAYLYTCLRRKLVETIRKQQKWTEEMPGEEGFYVSVDSNSYFIDSHLSLDHKKLLEQHCNELPARQREIIMMRFFEDMSYEEIAQILGLANAKTVRTMMYRGLSTLTQTLTPYKSQLLKTLLVIDLLY